MRRRERLVSGSLDNDGSGYKVRSPSGRSEHLENDMTSAHPCPLVWRVFMKRATVRYAVVPKDDLTRS
jgi:hypothetical protein